MTALRACCSVVRMTPDSDGAADRLPSAPAGADGGQFACDTAEGKSPAGDHETHPSQEVVVRLHRVVKEQVQAERTTTTPT